MTHRVLYITGEYPPMHGGIADYTEHLADAIADHGWEPLVMTSAMTDDIPDRVVSQVPKWDWSLRDHVLQTLRETDADIIHIQYQTGAFQMHPAINLLPLRLGWRRRPVPIVTTYHDLLRPYLFPKAGRLRRWMNRALAIGSDAIILTNEQDYRHVSSFKRFRNRTHRIPIGSNIPPVTNVDRDTILKRHGLEPDGFVVGFFGFLTPDKGIRDLLAAMERPDMDGVELLVISGELATTDRINRNYQEQMRKRLDDASIPVTQTGYLPALEVAEALAAVDVIALPYRSGASLRSGTLLAALQSGTPVITTFPRENDSLAPFSPGESIWLVPISDTDVLHEAIQILRQENTLRNQLAAKAAAQSTAFNWDSIAGRHLDVYQALLDR